jgi:hypothetical protein
VRQDPLIAHLDDPTDFAHALADALFEVLVGPLHARYPLLDQDGGKEKVEPKDAPSPVNDVLVFVAQATGQLFESTPVDLDRLLVPLDQLLADLELLEWIVLGNPSNQGQLLEEMLARYSNVPAADRETALSIEHSMRDMIVDMLHSRDR